MKKKTFKLGITGGIGSGKSLICNIFSIFGIPVYDADSRAKWLLNNDTSLIERVKEHFGAEAYIDEELNKVFIANIVFSDPVQLAALNGMVHPKVDIDYRAWAEKHNDKPYTLKEAALLFESGSYKTLDKVINVSASGNTRIRRVVLRDVHRNEEQAKAIIAKQMSDEERKIKADYTINNDGTILLIPQVWELHNKILQLDTASFS
ncbi:MAG: dephospho-CoA kinase [Bacteroidota bacterium]|nr:dephospho-CoA kinase [Bacteroidota bacterium]